MRKRPVWGGLTHSRVELGSGRTTRAAGHFAPGGGCGPCGRAVAADGRGHPDVDRPRGDEQLERRGELVGWRRPGRGRHRDVRWDEQQERDDERRRQRPRRVDRGGLRGHDHPGGRDRGHRWGDRLDAGRRHIRGRQRGDHRERPVHAQRRHLLGDERHLLGVGQLHRQRRNLHRRLRDGLVRRRCRDADGLDR